MPILSRVGRKVWSQRIFTWLLYGVLTVFGATMAIPFLITLTGSSTNAFDYDRFSILPRSLWSREDRFVKGMVYFLNGYPEWYAILQQEFQAAPANWTSWRAIGHDTKNVDRLAAEYLGADSARQAQWKLQAADYCEFTATYPIEDTLATFTNEEGADFISLKYERLWVRENPETAVKASWKERREAGLRLLSEAWGVPIPSFFAIRFDAEKRFPMGQQSWGEPVTAKTRDFNALCLALQHGFSTPGVRGGWKNFLRERSYTREEAVALDPLPADASEKARALWLEFARKNASASPVIPYPLKLVWLEFLGSDEARPLLGLKANALFDVNRYNAMAGTSYSSLRETPFPLPTEGFAGLQPLWRIFVETRYPLRLTRLAVTPELQARYQQFLMARYPSLENVNHLLGTRCTDWKQFSLAPAMPAGSGLSATGSKEVWIDFVKSLPATDRLLGSSEAAYQQFLLKKFATLEKINSTYGWRLRQIEEASPPFDKAYWATFLQNETAFTWAPLLENYGIVGKFLLSQGNAIPVTLWLIILSIFMTLTVNPIAGYALSRFNLKGKDKIILFCLATSAFPAMVSAIPGYLLMRDLGLLNTFFALVLPGAASGMSIFILKGFFDSLPPELYEAATIDGAKEWQIFSFVTLPMVKPILAVNALHAFIAAYGGWEWALIICQDKKMWTLSVWLYQASQWWAQAPWITTGGFVLASIPTLIVFLFCQNIILKGLIVPSMK